MIQANNTLSRDDPELLRIRDELLIYASAKFYERHPEYVQRFGARGREACKEDFAFHLDFLLSAVELGSAEPFSGYVKWVREVLSVRGIGSGHMQESLAIMGDFLESSVLAQPLRERLLAFLHQGIAVLGEAAGEWVWPNKHRPAPRIQLESFVGSLVGGNRQAAQLLINQELDNGADLLDVGVDIIQPALYRIGDLWQKNQISVAQEHLATAICQNLLAGAYSCGLFPLAQDSKGKALLLCVEGNQHSLGLRVVSDALESHGWETQFLGRDVPTNALLKQMEAFRPDMLALSVSLPQQLNAAKRLIASIRSEFSTTRPHIVMGGLAANQFDGLWKMAGADAWSASARTMVAELQ